MYRTPNININKRSFPVIRCTETPATSILVSWNLENGRRQHGTEKNMDSKPLRPERGSDRKRVPPVQYPR
jgi:hypothetical protein